MGKFVIRETSTGFVFDLKATNGETVAASEVYSTKASAIKGAESVAKCAASAKLADLTEGMTATNPKFELFQDRAGEFRFRLKARNGEVIATSEGYSTKVSCLNGIDSVRRNAPEAVIVD